MSIPPDNTSKVVTTLDAKGYLFLMIVMLAALSTVVMIGSGIVSFFRCLGGGQHGFHMGAGLAGWISFSGLIALLVFTALILMMLPNQHPARPKQR
jgi:hypothetical protein